MSDKFILETRFCMVSSDVNSVGKMLGLEWNYVCDLVSEAGLYGEDGAGYTTVERDEYQFDSELDQIFDKIFADNPECNVIYILDDC